MRRVLAIAIWVFAAAGIAFGQQSTTAAIHEGYATTSAGVRIHDLQAGDAASARALVLIPGWRLPAYLWEEQLKNFGRTNRVIAIDPRSQGESSNLLDLQKGMAASIPGAKWLAIEGTGHAVFVDEPEKFDEALRGFLETLRE
jgi:pimeloyl-ACP methyl ester carboxylesterase